MLGGEGRPSYGRYVTYSKGLTVETFIPMFEYQAAVPMPFLTITVSAVHGGSFQAHKDDVRQHAKGG